MFNSVSECEPGFYPVRCLGYNDTIQCISRDHPDNSLQYNRSLLSPFFHLQAKLRSALSRLGGADAIVMQTIVGEELVSLRGGYRVEFEPATFRWQGTETLSLSHHASTKCPPIVTTTV